MGYKLNSPTLLHSLEIMINVDPVWRVPRKGSPWSFQLRIRYGNLSFIFSFLAFSWGWPQESAHQSPPKNSIIYPFHQFKNSSFPNIGKIFLQSEFPGNSSFLLLSLKKGVIFHGIQQSRNNLDPWREAGLLHGRSEGLRTLRDQTLTWLLMASDVLLLTEFDKLFGWLNLASDKLVQSVTKDAKNRGESP